MPLSTAQARLLSRPGEGTVDIIYIQAVDFQAVPAAAEEVAQVLRTRHRTPIGQDDFTVFTQESILSTIQSVTGVLTIFLGGIAAISLLVGGIGIMNIMLVSVTERTREIGLRKALGARRRDILIQFIAESSLLSLIGGVVGIVFRMVDFLCRGAGRRCHRQYFHADRRPGCDHSGDRFSRRRSACSLGSIRPTGRPAWSRSKP